MAKTYTEIAKQIQKLQAQAKALRDQERAGVIAKIRSAIEAYELTAADLGLSGGRTPKASPPPPAKRASKARGKKLGKVPVKYRDKQGNSWTGRGLHPRWLRDALAGGAKIESFRV